MLFIENINLMKLLCEIFTLFLPSRNKLSRKKYPSRHISPLSLLASILAHISPLKMAFQKYNPVSLFLRFCVPYFDYNVDSTNISFTELVTCNLKAFKKIHRKTPVTESVF